MTETDIAPRNMVRLIMGAVLVWGVFLAVGAYRFNHNPARPAMVMACVLGFLGFWGLLLRTRRRRTKDNGDNAADR